MAIVVKEIKLETSKPNFIQAIVAKQNDCNSRFLKASLWDDGVQIPLLSSSSVTINAERPDGESDSFFGEVNDDNTATVPLHSWILELEGTVNCDISILDTEGRKLTSTTFVVLVEKASCSSEDITTDPEYNVLVQLLSEVNETIDAATTAAENANAAAGSVNTAIENAIAASGNANTAAGVANTAADNAVTATGVANAAAENANAEAKKAKAETDHAKLAAEDAERLTTELADEWYLLQKEYDETKRVIANAITEKVSGNMIRIDDPSPFESAISIDLTKKVIGENLFYFNKEVRMSGTEPCDWSYSAFKETAKISINAMFGEDGDENPVVTITSAKHIEIEEGKTYTLSLTRLTEDEGANDLYLQFLSGADISTKHTISLNGKFPHYQTFEAKGNLTIALWSGGNTKGTFGIQLEERSFPTSFYETRFCYGVKKYGKNLVSIYRARIDGKDLDYSFSDLDLARDQNFCISLKSGKVLEPGDYLEIRNYGDGDSHDKLLLKIEDLTKDFQRVFKTGDSYSYRLYFYPCTTDNLDEKTMFLRENLLLEYGTIATNFESYKGPTTYTFEDSDNVSIPIENGETATFVPYGLTYLRYDPIISAEYSKKNAVPDLKQQDPRRGDYIKNKHLIANSIRESASGNPLCIDGPSSFEHEIKVQLSGEEEVVHNVDSLSLDEGIELDVRYTVSEIKNEYGYDDDFMCEMYFVTVTLEEKSSGGESPSFSYFQYSEKPYEPPFKIGDKVIFHEKEAIGIIFKNLYYIRPRKIFTGKKVQKYGKNLLPYPYDCDMTTKTSSGITWTFHDDGTISATGAATGNSNREIFNYRSLNLPSGTYLLSGNPKTKGNSTGEYHYIRYKFVDQNGVEFIDSSAESGKDLYEGYHIIDAPNGISQVWMITRVRRVATVNNIVFKPMLSMVEADYEPYKEPIPYTADKFGTLAIETNGDDMTLVADNDITISAEYSVDTKKYIDKKLNELLEKLLNS